MKSLKYIFIILLFFIVHPIEANNPTITISGTIHSHNNNSKVAFATINIKGTTIGTVTDTEGNFKLKINNDKDYIIVIKSVGFKPKEINLKNIPKNQLSNLHFYLEEDLIGLEEVVISATRNETSRKDAPVIVNTLGLKQLAAVNAVCVSDGLNFQPGVRVENNCQNSGFQQVRIIGLGGSYSQILIDSRPIFSALGGIYGIEQLPVAMIDRVEVARGGGSALFGSNAIAGTINIITREPIKNSFEAGYNLNFIGGKAPDQNLTFNSSFVTENYDAGINVFAVHRKRDNYDADGDGFSEIGRLNSSAIGFRSYYRFDEFNKITTTYHYLNEFRRGGNKFDLQPHETDITEQTEHDVNGGEIIYDYYSKNLKNKLSIYSSAQYIKRKSYSGTNQDKNAYGNTSDLSFVGGGQFNHNAKKLIFSPATITVGAEYNLNNMHDVMPGYNRDLKQDISILGAFAQCEWKIKSHVLLLGARVDKHNLIKKVIISPRATFMAQINPKIQLRLNLSSGYRAPQAFDEDLHIEAVNGGVQLIKLDPNLRPEYSKSISLSMDSYYKIFKKESNFMIEGFFTQLDDVFVLEALETDENGNLIQIRRNGSGAKVYGINVENRTAITSKSQLQFGFTLQRSEYNKEEKWSEDDDAELLKVLPRSPNAYGYLTFSTNITKNFKTSISGTYTGSMKIPHFAGYIKKDILETSKSFFDLNIKLAYTFNLKENMSFTVEAGVKNILNSYQSDFDKGVNRDAGYIYGPIFPRSYFINIKI